MEESHREEYLKLFRALKKIPNKSRRNEALFNFLEKASMPLAKEVHAFIWRMKCQTRFMRTTLTRAGFGPITRHGWGWSKDPYYNYVVMGRAKLAIADDPDHQEELEKLIREIHTKDPHYLAWEALNARSYKPAHILMMAMHRCAHSVFQHGCIDMKQMTMIEPVFLHDHEAKLTHYWRYVECIKDFIQAEYERWKRLSLDSCPSISCR